MAVLNELSMANLSCHRNKSSEPIGKKKTKQNQKKKKKKKKNSAIGAPSLQMRYVNFGYNRRQGFRADIVWNLWWTSNVLLYYKLTYEPVTPVSR